jgi:MFS family permease
MAGLADRLREGQWIPISFIGMAVTALIYSQLTSVPLAIVVGAIAAILNAPSVVGRQLLIQRSTPREVRGRVFSAFFVMRDTMFMLGMAGAGLADIIDVRTLFFAQAQLSFAPLPPLTVKGKAQPIAVYRPTGRQAGAGPGAASRLGRAAERALLIDRLSPADQLTLKTASAGATVRLPSLPDTLSVARKFEMFFTLSM